MSIKRHIRVCEIMAKKNVSRLHAESIFVMEILEKYNTRDIELALDMFNAEGEVYEPNRNRKY